jgi:lipoprotein-anchoring transpeptidase ErfK/SrfK
MDSGKLLATAQSLESRGKLNEARRAYLDALKRARGPQPELEKRLAALNVRLVTTPEKMPEKVDYVVQRGDSLEKIARRYHTTVDLIMVSNRLTNPNLIKAGDHLRVFTGTFDLAVSKKRNEMVVKMNDEFFKRYRVGTGKFGKTPVGTFVVTEKIKEPVWWRPDGKAVPFGEKENILGTRWMTLRATGDTPDVKGYGIHGTWEDASIGKAESAGCVRMHNNEVEELFVFVPYHTPVVITE